MKNPVRASILDHQSHARGWFCSGLLPAHSYRGYALAVAMTG